MQNLEQKRAAHALKACENPKRFKTQPGDSDVVKPMTTMVLDCGILPAMAFAMEKGGAHEEVFKAYLDYRGNNSLPVKGYLDRLANADSATLRSVTAEFMAYARYLRRFANL